MDIVVQKFGGTSVGSVERIAAVAELIKKSSNKDKIVVTAGVPFNVPGSTNILRVAPVNEKSIFDGEID